MEKSEAEIIDHSLSEEQQAELTRLQHGIAVLDLFAKEVTAEERREDFLTKTRYGSETRQQILEGRYHGDKAKFERAIHTVRERYKIKSIARESLYEHALFLGREVRLTSKAVIFSSKEDEDFVTKQHGEWRAAFASKQRAQEREDYRHNFLEPKIRAITGEKPPEPTFEAVTNSREDRAVLIVRALNAIARRSMLSGLRVAVADPRYKDNIYDRYKEGTPHLDKASMRKFDRLYYEAQQYFWDANNYDDVIRTGGIEEKLLRRLVQHEWDKFVTQFEFSPHREHRDKYRKGLKRYIPAERLPETKID
jgi:hypothetical protein